MWIMILKQYCHYLQSLSISNLNQLYVNAKQLNEDRIFIFEVIITHEGQSIWNKINPKSPFFMSHLKHYPKLKLHEWPYENCSHYFSLKVETWKSLIKTKQIHDNFVYSINSSITLFPWNFHYHYYDYMFIKHWFANDASYKSITHSGHIGCDITITNLYN